MRFSKISLFRMVLERLKLYQFLVVCNELLPMHNLGCWKGGRNSKISAKMAVFLVRVARHKFHHSGPPRKTYGRIHWWPLEKILPSSMHTSMLNYTIFVKYCVVLHHLATLFNNTNAVSKPQQGDRLCTVYCAKHYETCQIPKNVLQTTLTKYC